MSIFAAAEPSISRFHQLFKSI